MKAKEFHVIIPARFESSRLPGKPLARINGKEMILHVCERARQSGAQTVCVATDHRDIEKVITNAGFSAVMTRKDHESGSDRVYEAAEKMNLKNDDIIVNVQGDEPFIPVKNITQVAGIIDKKNAMMSTLCCPIESQSEANNPNSVKVIFDKFNKAIYFSRSKIPFNRDKDNIDNSGQALKNYFRHIGIYAYRKSFLKQFVEWPVSTLESIEKLEQLRVIENGESIYLEVLESSPPSGIDTPEDLEFANRIVQNA